MSYLTSTRRSSWFGALLLVALAGGAPAARAEEPNTLEGARLSVEAASGAVERLLEPGFPEEGAGVNPNNSVTLYDRGQVELSFGRTEQIKAMAIQANGRAVLVVETSLDGQAWEHLWRVPSQLESTGLRTRLGAFAQPRQLRYLRVRCAEDHTPCSVSKLSAYARVPDAPPVPTRNYRLPSRSLFNNMEKLGIARVVVAGLAALLLALEILWRRSTRSRALAAVLLGMGVFSALSYWNLLRFHDGNPLHEWDIFHYYVGAKYFPELGYTRLYACTLLADQEAKATPNFRTHTRDLQSNLLVDTSTVNVDECRQRFTPERWREFSADVAWFRGRFQPMRWLNLLDDHGYNGSPVWTMVGGALASTGPATERQIRLLALIDPLLLAVMWALVYWAFGWKTLCVALIFWGTNYPARFLWTGGGFLRQGWLVLSIASICLMRRGWMTAAGAALTAAALLGVFPGFLFAGVALTALIRMVHLRRPVLSPDHRRLALGCAAALSILVPVSVWRVGSAAWPAFVDNSRKHLATALTNNVGMNTLLGYSPENRARLTYDRNVIEPYLHWKQLRYDTQTERRTIFLVLVVAYLAFLAWSIRGADNWQATALSIGLVPVAAELTCYYYSILLGLGLLREKVPWSAPLLCFYAAVTWICSAVWDWYDEQFTWISAATLVLVVLVTWCAGRQQRRTGSSVPLAAAESCSR